MTFSVLSSRVLVVSCLLSACGACDVYGQTSDRSIDERLLRIEASLTELHSRLAEVATSLRAILPPPPIAEVKGVQVASRGAMKGSTAAKIVLIEFSDFECPFCGRHANSVLSDITRTYIETGKLQYEFRHLPLEQIHPSARSAAEASECAAKQSLFWPMHDRLFQNQKSLKPADLSDHARAIGLEYDAFTRCVASRETAERIDADLAVARKLGITSTPTFLLGQKEADGTIRVFKRLAGAQPFLTFRQAIDPLVGQ